MEVFQLGMWEKLVEICDSLGLVLQNKIFFILVFALRLKRFFCKNALLHRGIFHVYLFSFNACDDN